MKRLSLLLVLCAVWMAAEAIVPPRDPSMRRRLREEARVALESGKWYDEVNCEWTDRPQEAPRRIGTQASAPLTAMGSPKVPVILVQFSDKRFISGLGSGEECETDEQAQRVNAFYQLYANGRGDGSYYRDAGSAGAIMEYFRDQSNGQFTPEFVIIGPVTLDKSYAYYGEDRGSGHDNVHMSDFYKDAIAKAQEQFSDWSQFDNDGNNSVDMAFFIYAGEGENAFKDAELQADPALANLIWPKERATGGTIGTVKYGCYACCNETYEGQTDGIGVFVHELSHALGLPDFYDTLYVAYGLDYWDIMDSGCYCLSGYSPCGYSAYEKDFMGWQPLVTLDWNSPQVVTLEPMYLNGQSYKIVNPQNQNEFFVLENRQNRRWDVYIGRGLYNDENYGTWLMHGMLITHVDYNSSRWSGNNVNTNSSHQYITILPADGQLDSFMFATKTTYVSWLESTQADPFPGRLGKTSLESDEIKVWTSSGTLDVALRNITETEEGNITFDFCPHGQNPEHPVTVTARDYEIEYGDAIPQFEYDVEGDELRGTPSVTCTATSKSAPGTYDIVVEKGSVENTLVTFVNATLTIKPAPLLITAVDQEIILGDPLPTFTVTYKGLKNDETPANLTKMPSIICDANATGPAADYEIIVWGAESPNYDISYKNGTLTILQPTTVIAHNLMREYGDDNPELTYSLEGVATQGKPVLTCEATKTSPVGTYPITVAAGTIEGRHLQLKAGTLTVKPAPLTISADDKAIMKGEPLPEWTVSYKGFKNDEDASVLTKPAVVTCTATAESEPGEYPITVSGAESKNYEISFVNGKLTIGSAVGIDALTLGSRSEIYDLAGRRITDGRLAKGIYIVNGKKVVVK